MSPRNVEKQRKCQRDWARKNKVKTSIRKKELRNTIRGRSMALNRGCRSRSLSKDIPYDLDSQWIEKKMLKGCAVTGYMFILDVDAIHMDILVPSLDRIDPDKGYTKDNVQVVCLGVNRLKGRNSLDAMYELSSMITKHGQLRLKDHEHMMPD